MAKDILEVEGVVEVEANSGGQIDAKVERNVTIVIGLDIKKLTASTKMIKLVMSRKINKNTCFSWLAQPPLIIRLMFGLLIMNDPVT